MVSSVARARLLRSSAVGFLFLAGAFSAGAAFAQEVIDGGEMVFVPGDRPERWTIPGDGILTIGSSTLGGLIIQDGATVNASRTTFLGFRAGSTGFLEINGPGSRLDTGNLIVGTEGVGVLMIDSGAVVQANDLSAIGTLRGSQGTAVVTGTGSRLIFKEQAWVGQSGTGSLTIADGGAVLSELGARIGNFPGSSGSAVVSGPGSRWDSPLFLAIGNAKGGDGTLTIQDGGLVTSGFAILGVEPQPTSPDVNGIVARVMVTGAESRWEIADRLHISDGVAGTSIVTVKDGGFISAGNVVLATLARGTGILNIGAGAGEAANAPGRFETPTLAFGEGAGILNFNHTGTAYAFSAALSGLGDVTQMAGTTILTGNSMGFTGRTQVSGGDLRVNGSLGGQVAVAGGGTLSGTGSIDRLQGDAGGTVAPGDNGIGTLSVAGDAVFTEGSTLALKVAPDGSSDLLAVAGRTTISGSGTVLHVTGTGTSFPVTNIYTVLTSESGIDGQFASVQDTLPDLDLQAIYQPNVLQLRYVSTSGVTSPKQIHPSAQAAALKASRLFAQTMRRRGGFYAGTNENTRAFTAEPTLHKLAVWSAAMGETSQTDPSGQTSGWEADTGGIAFGLENRFERFDGVIGLAGAITNTQIDSGSSDADVNAWHLGGYGSAAVGSLTLSGALSYAWQEYEFGRHVPLVGGANRARGKTDGGTFTASGEAMYDLGLGYPSNGLRFGPLATLETIHSQRDGFAETGAGVLNLNVSRKSAHQIISGLGVAVGLEDRSIAGMRIRADARVTWEHVFGDRAVTAASAIPIAGTSFAASSAATDRDRIALGLGGAVHLSERIAAHIRYDGSFSGTSTHHAGAAGLTYRF